LVKFEISQSQEELTSHSGLALVGVALQRMRFCERIDDVRLPKAKAEPTIAHSDVLKSYIGLLCQGKSDYEAIEPFRAGNEFFPLAFDIEVLPSCETLRQRLDQLGTVREPIATPLKEQNLRMLKEVGVTVTPALRELVALDIDVSPFDNSKTHKEGVSRTYKGYDGYAPIFAYLGVEGYLVNTELRPGKQHCQNGTPAFLRESLRLARLLTDAPLLIKMDSGNDSADNLSILIQEEVDFIIKRNLRRESPEEWLTMAKAHGEAESVRVGKTVYRGSITISRLLTLRMQTVEGELRCVFEVTERTITADGQMLLVPQVEVDTYWTSLPDSPAVIIEQYHQHSTSEQYHSELKSDMDLERLPSGKFSTNQLVLHCAMVAYNILRMIGQIANDTGNFPFHKRAFRRRIKTVIQNLIYLAARLVYHARSYKLAFGRWSPWVPDFARAYQRLRC
jgi:hypothetical protein